MARWLNASAATLVLLTFGPEISHAATDYVSPTGRAQLSRDANAPGSLSFALAGTGDGAGAAQQGDVVILEDGVYDGTPNGYRVYRPGVTLRARSWHGATIKNSTDAGLISPANPGVTGDICQGIVFGPTPGNGWSGGGADGWQFLDCVFTHCGGVGSASHGLFRRDVFTDAYSNAFDIGGSESDLNTGVLFKDCIARRNNQWNADDDSVGNKDDFTRGIVYDDLIAYDNNGTGLWFDTDNDGWTIENSTFFGDHGGNNWYTFGTASGLSTSQLIGDGQDGQVPTVGQPIKCISGTAANVGFETVISAVTGNTPVTITVSPALPAVPNGNDQFYIQQLGASAGDGFITEANDCGTFTNNVVYGMTDAGFFDHSSGGKTYGGSGGLVVTHNLFAYNGQGFFVWSDARDQGPALVEYNQFKFDPGKTSPFASWGSTPGKYPSLGGFTFDHNVYDPDGKSGGWLAWFGANPPMTASGVTRASQAPGSDYLQDPKTWNQDLHSRQTSIAFRSAPVATYIWPAAKDTDWKHVYRPNTVFGLSNSIHQIDDTDGAVHNTIDAAIAGHRVGDIILMPVSAHTPLAGSVCEVYDLNGRWVTLRVRSGGLAAFEKSVPGYVTCTPGNKTRTYRIRVRLTSVAPYHVSATY